MDIAAPLYEIRKRTDGLRARLAAQSLDGALLLQAVDVYYFSGSRQNAALWVPVDRDPVLLVRKSFQRASEEGALRDIRPFPPRTEIPALFGPARRIGMTFDTVPVGQQMFYSGLLPDASFKDISPALREMRAVKSDWELQQLRMSGRALADAFAKIPSILEPGLREIDAAAEFEFLLRSSGIGGFLRIRGFNQEISGLVSSGENAALPGCFDGPVTGRGFWTAAPFGPSDRVIGRNVPILIDYGGFYNGYITDMTRMFSFGDVDSRSSEIFAKSLEIQDWIVGRLVPGAVCEEIFAGAAQLASEAGLGEYFMGYPGELGKFVGHGVGLELDELPVLAQRFRLPLQEGNVIAVEPKFLMPGIGAIGIENTFAIGQGKAEKLTLIPDEWVRL